MEFTATAVFVWFLVAGRGLWGAGSTLFNAKVCWSFLDVFPAVYSSQKAFPARRNSPFSARNGLLAARSFSTGSWLFQTAAGRFFSILRPFSVWPELGNNLPHLSQQQTAFPLCNLPISAYSKADLQPVDLAVHLSLSFPWVFRFCCCHKIGQLKIAAGKLAAKAASSQPSSKSLAAPSSSKGAAPAQPLDAAVSGNGATNSHLPTANVSGKGTAISSDKTKVHSLVFHESINGLEASSRAGMVLTSNSSGSRLEEVLPAKTGQTDATCTTKTSYAGLFSTNRRLMDEKKLRKIEDKDETLKLDTNDLIDFRSKLGHCLVGYIAGKFSGLKAIGALSKSWGATFQLQASGWLVFKFATEEDMQRIVTGGPYLVFGRQLMLKSITACFGFQEDDISLTPVWGTLPSLLLECWNPNALSKIGSRLGNPVAMDSLTMNIERISYARILVEVDASKELVDRVEFILPDGTARKQPVRYEFTPKFCTTCNRFGHLRDSCQGNRPAVVSKSAPDATVKPITPKKAHDSEWTLVQRWHKAVQKE
ncbi:UNVERIFIED_CONTAM: hypothetical protein Sradi_3178000 [Sesamum radiatum]|uniref:DUF4283 domain-containing protein n=1 Tax=Sesamum radiatum TaxID=300843 RepID=A0AAW2REV9_SESRA